ncbi:selenium cofactor biosynthesis protein YqeC [Geotalea sp. SG265]|uniref:selenium cofactor biosynthesis protein YqeC n=1 Tax=Geotalea sp. SG265 TaxID=2922867 RepID=UPI001FAED52F|nr:selenium cofactor biosynthesis protein YqeC [Geotalea sp. SG265]
MESFAEIVGIGPGGVISIVGGGGKTSLMFHLARQLAYAGKRVLTTTTTKILIPSAEQSETLLVSQDPQVILRQARAHGCAGVHVSAVSSYLPHTDKLQGFPPEAIRTFEDSGLFDWVVVEADGAARKPLKAPAAHEPVIPENTSIVVALAGLEVLGRPLGEEMVFRSELAGELMQLSPGETITVPALARLLAHPSGAFKGAPAQARRFVFLNKADSPQMQEEGAAVALQLSGASPPVVEAVMVGQLLQGISVHRVYAVEKP